jgi:hypothetical protein
MTIKQSRCKNWDYTYRGGSYERIRTPGWCALRCWDDPMGDLDLMILGIRPVRSKR